MDRDIFWPLLGCFLIFGLVGGLLWWAFEERNTREQTLTGCGQAVQLCAESRGVRCGRVDEFCKGINKGDSDDGR